MKMRLLYLIALLYVSCTGPLSEDYGNKDCIELSDDEEEREEEDGYNESYPVCGTPYLKPPARVNLK